MFYPLKTGKRAKGKTKKLATPYTIMEFALGKLPNNKAARPGGFVI
jgi:hypothetical protein